MAESLFSKEKLDATEEPPSWRDRLQNIDLGSALAFLCFSVALLCGSLDEWGAFLKPVAALGLLAGLLGGVLPALWRGRNAGLPSFLSVLCLLVLLFMGSWSSSPSPPPLVRIPLKQKGMVAYQPIREDDWVDASTNAVKRGDVRVEVVSAWIGPLELTQGKSSVKSSAERFFAIRLRVSYEGILFQQIPYQPWTDRAGSPSKHPPTLADNQGRTYVQKTFEPGWKAAGQPDVDALTPGHQVNDVLV